MDPFRRGDELRGISDAMARARAEERERCAKLAETIYARDAFRFELGTAIAAAIRELK